MQKQQGKVIAEQQIAEYISFLRENEKSENTIEKYRRDVTRFVQYCRGRPLDKNLTVEYKASLKSAYKTTSINSMLVPVNSFLSFLDREDCRVRLLKCQKKIFCDERDELKKDEYLRMLRTAKAAKEEQLFLLLQTICGTGIRVSELKFVTVEAVNQGYATVECKNKQRIILIPHKLQGMLKSFATKQKIQTGSIFLNAKGLPLTRFMVWRAMKRICKAAGVDQKKVFPHNLRHLFARTFYQQYHDLARLADLLGHSSIETTRIYLIENAKSCYRTIAGLGLVTELGRMKFHPAELIT